MLKFSSILFRNAYVNDDVKQCVWKKRLTMYSTAAITMIKKAIFFNNEKNFQSPYTLCSFLFFYNSLIICKKKFECKE